MLAPRHSMRISFLYPIVLSTTWWLVLGLFSSTLATAQDLDQLVVQAEAAGTRTGVVVLNLKTGECLHRHRAREAFAPASNQKLLTAAACLQGLGVDYRMRTRFRLSDGVL